MNHLAIIIPGRIREGDLWVLLRAPKCKKSLVVPEKLILKIICFQHYLRIQLLKINCNHQKHQDPIVKSTNYQSKAAFLSLLSIQLAHFSIYSQSTESKLNHLMKSSLLSTRLLQITMKNNITINNLRFTSYLSQECLCMNSNKTRGNKSLWIIIIGTLSEEACITSSKTHHQEGKEGHLALPTTSF